MEGKISKRILYLDFLRTISIAGVMAIHFSSKILSSSEIGESRWIAFILYNCLGRFAVPVFFMISGSIFLDPKRHCSMKRMYRHNIFHLGTAFLFWSFLHAVLDTYDSYMAGAEVSLELLKDFVKAFVLGPTHLWFLFVLTALYIITPFLRKIAEDQRLTQYFLILWVIFGMLSSFTVPIGVLSLFREFMSKFKMNFVMGYSGYFLLGYYLRAYFHPAKRRRAFLYGVGVIAYVFTCIATGILSWKKGGYIETYLDGTMLNCMFMATAVFVGVKERLENRTGNGKFSAAVYKIADCSFGIYLIHMLVFRLIQLCGIADFLGQFIIGVPLIIIIVYVLCYVIVSGIRKIPVLGKTIV